MKAYKGFKKHEDGTLWCRDFQYEVGKTYTFEDEPVLCEQGFHACHEPWQCWLFYPNNGYIVYYEVECSGKIIESNNGDGKFVCTEITLVREMQSPENKFDWCGTFGNGYAMIKLDGKYNYINSDGKLISEQWFDDCWCFYNGCAMVYLKDKKYNHINTDGEYVSEQWWDYCCNFGDGYARVELNGKWYKIDKTGKIMEE